MQSSDLPRSPVQIVLFHPSAQTGGTHASTALIVVRHGSRHDRSNRSAQQGEREDDQRSARRHRSGAGKHRKHRRVRRLADAEHHDRQRSREPHHHRAAHHRRRPAEHRRVGLYDEQGQSAEHARTELKDLGDDGQLRDRHGRTISGRRHDQPTRRVGIGYADVRRHRTDEFRGRRGGPWRAKKFDRGHVS